MLNFNTCINNVCNCSNTSRVLTSWTTQPKDNLYPFMQYCCTTFPYLQTLQATVTHTKCWVKLIELYTKCCLFVQKLSVQKLSVQKLSIYISSHEERHQAFPYCKWRKAGWGLGTRLWFVVYLYLFVPWVWRVAGWGNGSWAIQAQWWYILHPAHSASFSGLGSFCHLQ